MSIFERILSRVFGPAPAETLETATTEVASAPPLEVRPISKAEVEAMIEKLASAKSQKFNWRESIVDLLKLLGLDSSLAARKELARELGYAGLLDGSAKMNLWLHAQVMHRLAESGGQVPESLTGVRT
jgi:hypothetical protein